MSEQHYNKSSKVMYTLGDPLIRDNSSLDIGRQNSFHLVVFHCCEGSYIYVYVHDRLSLGKDNWLGLNLVTLARLVHQTGIRKLLIQVLQGHRKKYLPTLEKGPNPISVTIGNKTIHE